MKFEHLVEINHPDNPMIPQMTRNQLWQGLMLRAEDATQFLPGLEQCVILERGNNELRRQLNFGASSIEDKVTWHTLKWMSFDVNPSDVHAGGSLKISIEEPAENHLFLRFSYATTLGEVSNDEDAAYGEFVKSAYHESDIEMVRVIRTMVSGNTAH